MHRLRSFLLPGDYAVAGSGVRETGVGGVATATISVTNVPANSQVVAAYLYWATLGNGLSAQSAGTNFALTASRLDAVDWKEFLLGNLLGGFSLGAYMVVTPNPLPRLRLTEVAGQLISTNSDDESYALPAGTSTNITVTVEARDFNRTNVLIEVVATPDYGSRRVVQTNINNLAANPAAVQITIPIPPSIPVKLNAWTR